MSHYKSCTIVLPCYNPQQGWAGRVIAQYKAITASTSLAVHVLLVNDGSTQNVTDADITLIKAAIPSFKYISYVHNKGKGYALRTGIHEAEGEIIIYTDIDFPYTTDSFIKILNELANGDCDVAVGIKNEQYYRQVPPARRYISKMLRSMIGLFFNIPITDTQCGLKGLTQNAKAVFLSTTIDRYLFDLQFIRDAHKNNLKLKTIEIALNPEVVLSKMNYKILLPELLNFLKIVATKK